MVLRFLLIACVTSDFTGNLKGFPADGLFTADFIRIKGLELWGDIVTENPDWDGHWVTAYVAPARI